LDTRAPGLFYSYCPKIGHNRFLTKTKMKQVSFPLDALFFEKLCAVLRPIWPIECVAEVMYANPHAK
jgi:hypothetical protein